jgi:tRNA 2-selenouridine synthase
MATVMSQVGWRVGVLAGGYKTWRRRVVSELHGEGPFWPTLLIDGLTGTGKTEIIRRLIANGAPSLDLEYLAGHRGSAFGADPSAGQPSQKLFESRLWGQAALLPRNTPLVLEAESARIGRLSIPKRLWSSMRAAPYVVVEASREARAAFLAEAYRERAADAPFVSEGLARLKSFHPKSRIERWSGLLAAGDLILLIDELLRDHYDLLYARARQKRHSQPLATIPLSDLTPGSLELAAAAIEKLATTDRFCARDVSLL